MSQEARLAFGAIWPAVAVAGAIMCAAWLPLRRAGSKGQGYWGGALAIGLGFVAGFLILTKGWPGMPPKERWQWLLPMAMVATVSGLIAAFWRPSGGLRFLPPLVAVMAVGYFLHPPSKI